MKKIKVVVTNRLARVVSNYSDKTYDKLMKHWSYAVPSFHYMKSSFPGWDGRKKMFKWNKLSAGLFWATYRDIEKEFDIKFKIVTDLVYPRMVVSPKNPGLVTEKKYRSQAECVGKMLRMSLYGGGLVIAATGWGKTRVAGMLFGCLKGEALFVVDELHLLRQAKRDIEAYLGEKVGIVGDSIFKPRRITVATVQTMHLHRHDPKFKRWTRSLEVIVVDEIHVQMGRRNFDVVSSIEPRAVFGLTATLEMKKKPVRLRAWSLAGPICYSFPLKKGVAKGILSRGVILRVIYRNHIDA